MNFKHLLMDLNRIERVINETVMDEVERGLINDQAPETIKLPIDDLLGDLIIAILDDLRLPKYIVEKDVEGEFLTLQIDEKRCLNEYQKQISEWKAERDELVREYFTNKGVF